MGAALEQGIYQTEKHLNIPKKIRHSDPTRVQIVVSLPVCQSANVVHTEI